MLISNMGPMLYGAGWGWTPAAIFAAVAYADLNFADPSKLFQVAGGTSPVTTAGQPVGQINGSGNAGEAASQATSSQRPTWQGSYAEFDGVDDYLDLNVAALDITRDAGGLTLWTVFRPAAVAVMTLLGLSTATATAARLSVQILANGALRVNYRRADADGAAYVDSAAGVIGAGTDQCLVLSVDFAGGGSEALKVWLNGAQVISAPISAPGNISDTAPARGRVGGSLSGVPPTQLTNGRVYRCGLAKRACSVAEARRITATIRRTVG